MKNYTAKEIKSIRDAIREGHSLMDVAQKMSKQMNRSYKGVYVRVCKEAKKTRNRKTAVVNKTVVTPTVQPKTLTFNVKSIEIVGNKVTFNF